MYQSKGCPRKSFSDKCKPLQSGPKYYAPPTQRDFIPDQPHILPAFLLSISEALRPHPPLVKVDVMWLPVTAAL